MVLRRMVQLTALSLNFLLIVHLHRQASDRLINFAFLIQTIVSQHLATTLRIPGVMGVRRFHRLVSTFFMPILFSFHNVSSILVLTFLHSICLRGDLS